MKTREALEEESKAYLKEIDGQITEVKDGAERVVKLALIAGVGSLGIYWILNSIFGDKEAETSSADLKKKKRKKFKKLKSAGSGSNMLSNELKNQVVMVALKLAADQLKKFLEDSSSNNGEE